MSITSDELNFLVYRYLQESGFVHSAFVFAYESLVGRTNLATADIPPGALINFLQKGLQYVEIEKELELGSSSGKSDLLNGIALFSGTKEAKGVDAMEIDSSGKQKKSSSSTSTSSDAARTTMDLEGKSRVTSADMHILVNRADVTDLKGHKAEVLVCAWNPKMNVLASGSGDSTVRVWTVPRGASGLPASTAASQDPKILVHSDGSASKDVSSLDWRSNGLQLATGTYDGQARIWSLEGQLEKSLLRHRGTIFCMKWNKEGNYLLTGSIDKTAIVWDTTTGPNAPENPVVQQYENHSMPVLDVDWRDETTFATCSTDKMIYYCKVGAKDPVCKFSGHTNEVNALKWSPSGRLLASASDDCTAKIWNPDSPDSCLVDLAEHTQDIYQIKWCPSSATNLLATASSDTTIKLWDVEAAKCMFTLSDHQKAVYSINFSPDGQYLASGSMDSTLRIWSVRDGKCVKKYKGGGGIYEVSWNKDGDKVAACFGLPSNSVCIIDFRK